MWIAGEKSGIQTECKSGEAQFVAGGSLCRGFFFFSAAALSTTTHIWSRAVVYLVLVVEFMKHFNTEQVAELLH